MVRPYPDTVVESTCVKVLKILRQGSVSRTGCYLVYFLKARNNPSRKIANVPKDEQKKIGEVCGESHRIRQSNFRHRCEGVC